MPWLFSAWGPLSVGLGKVTQGRAAKREAALALYIADLCRLTAATANAIWLSEVGVKVKKLTVCFALIWPGGSSCAQN